MTSHPESVQTPEPETIAASKTGPRWNMPTTEAVDERVKKLGTNATLAAAGGFLDGFTYVGHGHVFANAMTGNVVLLGVDAVSGSWRLCLRHLLPIFMFLMGVATAKAVRLPASRRVIRYPQLAVIGFEILALFILSLLPPATPSFVFTMSIAFAASVQMATFREINGKSYSSTFTTGNLRTMIDSAFDWFFSGRLPTQLRTTLDFATICSMFLLGATVGALATPRMLNHTLSIEVLALLAVEGWLLRSPPLPHRAP